MGAQQDSSVALLFNSLLKKHPDEISIDKIGSYQVSIDQKSKMFQLRKFRKRRIENEEQKKIGHGAQAMLTAEPMFDEESNCVEICLELVDCSANRRIIQPASNSKSWKKSCRKQR